MSLLTCYRFLQFFLVVKDDNELLGSLLSLGFIP
jgi:hypothetical protein